MGLFDSFESKIKPFFLVNGKNSNTSVCLYVDDFKRDIFKSRAKEGFLGNGYDWELLATTFINERMPLLDGIIEFDSESDMFCAYSSDKKALKKFVMAFKEACENEAMISDILSKTEPEAF